jgi:micrococcal nuclease
MAELKVNEYDVVLLKAVDGDTVDVDIDLGFGVWLKSERVRIMGIDTPESRTRDLVEKLFGLAAKARLEELLQDGGILVTTEEKNGEDMRGKFGRILGDFKIPSGRLVTDILIEEGH